MMRFRIPAMCAAVVTLATCNTVKPVKPAGPAAGPRESPVVHTRWRTVHKGHANIGNGVYIREDDDLVVNTPMPIVLRRTYNSGDRFARPFGLATTHAGEWWLHGNGDHAVPWGELILADGARIRFERITPGPTEEGAVLRHDSTPTEFNGSLLSFTGALWELRFPDGSFASFGPPKVCFLQERRDADGHRIQYVRDASNTLLRMESEGQSIALEYDAQKRIVRASDTTGKDVSYGYDDLGRLVRAAGNNGVVRQYEYDERNNMVAIREPGRIVRNWFDEKGRWSRQVVKSGEDDPDPYVATAHYVVEGNSVVETDLDEGDGLNVFRFNEHHYVLSETLDADGDAPIVFTYDRDEITNVLKGATLSCRAASGPISRRVRVESGNDKAVRDALVRENCLRRP
jgi:YD repeat-containing protein